jgi:plasmid stability protein
MLRGEFDSAGESTPAELHEAYLARLRETIETVGAETVAKRSGVDDQVVLAIADGETPELTLEAAAAVLAADPEMPPGESIAAEARDILLMGMTTAVVDVDALAAGVDVDLEPKELQQKVEGRYPVTLAEYAHVHAFLERQ